MHITKVLSSILLITALPLFGQDAYLGEAQADGSLSATREADHSNENDPKSNHRRKKGRVNPKCEKKCNPQDFHLATECQCCYQGYLEGKCHRRCSSGRPSDYHPESQCAFDHCRGGIWLPEDPPIFRPFAADPRQLTYSVGRRYNDAVFPKTTVPVSFWDTFPIYRRFNVWPWGGMLQMELDGALWAIFAPDSFSAPLINADYYVGLPITYAWCNWSIRFRFFHISSHIGDEYLLLHPDFDRRNPSSETIDLFISHDLTDEIRYYGGLGWVVNCDESFPVKRFLAEAGVELRIPILGFCDRHHNICGRPIYAMHFRYKPDFSKHIDATYILGYEFGKCCGSRKRWRTVFEYHDGYSVEGQFSKEPTNYFSFRLSYGY